MILPASWLVAGALLALGGSRTPDAHAGAADWSVPAAAGESARGSRPTTSGAGADARAFGLLEAIDRASQRDPRVAVTDARRRIEDARRVEATLGFAPDVLVGGAYRGGFPGSGSHLELSGMLGSPFFRHYVAGVDASWNLVDLLRTPIAVRAAEAGVDAAAAARAAAEREVALVVIDLFERALAASESSEVLSAEATARRRQILALQARVEAGTTAREQMSQAEAGLFDVEAEIAAARAEETSARSALRALTGEDRVLAVPLRMEIPSQRRELPEIRMARASRRQAAEVRKLRDMEWLPRVVVGASAGYANPGAGEDPGLYAAGVALAFPLSGALRERSRRDAEAAAAEVRAFEAESTIERLAMQAAEIDAAIDGLSAALPAAEQGRRAAEQALDAVAVRAEAGMVPQVDVEAALSVLRRAQLRVRMLRLRLDGLGARRALVTTGASPPA